MEISGQSKIAISLLAVILLLGIVAGGNTIYQNHLSSDFKRILVAANGEMNSAEDIREYLHQARLAVRTKKDQQVLKDFQQALELGAIALDARNKVREDEGSVSEISQSISSEQRTIAMMNTFHDSYGARLYQKKMDTRKQEQIKQIAKLDVDQTEADHANDQLVQHLSKLRSELGLSVIPISK